MEKNKMLIDATHPEETRVVVLRGRPCRGVRFRISRPQTAARQYLPRQGHARRALAAGGLRRVRRQPARLPGLQRNPSRLLPDPGRRPPSPASRKPRRRPAEAEAEARAVDAHAEQRSRHRRANPAPRRTRRAPAMSETLEPIEPEIARGKRRLRPRATIGYTIEASGPDARPASPSPATRRSAAHARAYAANENAGRQRPILELPTRRSQGADSRAKPSPTTAHDAKAVAPRSRRPAHPRRSSARAGRHRRRTPWRSCRVRPRGARARYKIQEVIKRRQIILVQVVKEERGNKGAALTTYLSLAGRYSVLMPNTDRGGGICRKITQPQDRKRLKAIAHDLDVPRGHGPHHPHRRAPSGRSRRSSATTNICCGCGRTSANRRCTRRRRPRLRGREPDQAGDPRPLRQGRRDGLGGGRGGLPRGARLHAHADAEPGRRTCMRYREPDAAVRAHRIERQLNADVRPYVTLRSGGYLVINQTEALVADRRQLRQVDARVLTSRRRRCKTNIEAAEETARQMQAARPGRPDRHRLHRHGGDSATTGRSRDAEGRPALRPRAHPDRAASRHFGLMEMSRQRRRTGMLEGSTRVCPHCQGTGTCARPSWRRSGGAARGSRMRCTAGERTPLVATTTPAVALYILNNKRGIPLRPWNADERGRYRQGGDRARPGRRLGDRADKRRRPGSRAWSPLPADAADAAAPGLAGDEAELEAEQRRKRVERRGLEEASGCGGGRPKRDSRRRRGRRDGASRFRLRHPSPRGAALARRRSRVKTKPCEAALAKAGGGRCGAATARPARRT